MKTIALIATGALGACASSGIIPHSTNHPADPQAPRAPFVDIFSGLSESGEAPEAVAPDMPDMSDHSQHRDGYTMPRTQTPVLEHRHEAKTKLYVCPMHPDVTSHDPGTCSICHMPLTMESEE